MSASDWLFSLPLALVLVIAAVPVLITLAWITYRLAMERADRKIAEVLAPLPSITDGFDAMGDEAATVVWIFGDERPRLTVIDGGEGTAA